MTPPDVSDGVIVWESTSDENYLTDNLFAYDIASKEEFLIFRGSDELGFPAISGATVVWTDYRDYDGHGDLYACRLQR